MAIVPRQWIKRKDWYCRSIDRLFLLSAYCKETNTIYIAKEAEPIRREYELNNRLLLHVTFFRLDIEKFFTGLLMCDDYHKLLKAIKDKKLK